MFLAVMLTTSASIGRYLRSTRWVLALAIASSVGLCPLPGQMGPTAPVLITDVKLGFGGVARVGAWIPASAVLRGTEDQRRKVTVTWLAPDPEANECRFVDRELYEIGAAESTIHRLIRLGRAAPSAAVQVEQEGRVIARQDVPSTASIRFVPSTSRFILGLGEALMLDTAVRSHSSIRHRDITVAHVADSASLPHEALAYDSVDVVVLLESDHTFVRSISDEQWDALIEWVQGGGRVVCSLSAATTLETATASPMARLLGIERMGTEHQRDTTGLEKFAGVDQRIDVSVREGNAPWDGLSVARLAPSQAKTLAFDGLGAARTPWIQQSTLGLGVITLVLFDLRDPTLDHWTGTPQLVGRIIESALGFRDLPMEGRNRELSHLGYTDLMGQLRMALDRIQGVRPVAFSLIALAIGLYVVLVSAGDYLLLRHVLRNYRWTWLTFPLLIGVTCLAGYAWAISWKGTEQRSNQIDFIDIDTTTGTTRLYSWCHLYSPRARHEMVQWLPEETALPASRSIYRLCSWEGLPGAGFGGMESQVASPFFRDQYTSFSRRIPDPPDGRAIHLLDVPLPAWSNRGFEGRGLCHMAIEAPPPLRADSLSQLQGTIHNPLQVRLRDCGVYFDRWYYDVGTLEAGGRLELTPRNQALDLKARLTRKRIVDAKEVTSPWDPVATDFARIAEMIMFHQAAGGTSFTGLSHDYRDRLDMSQHLLLNTAVVVGRPSETMADFLVGEDQQSLPGDRRATLVRFTIPVQPTATP